MNWENKLNAYEGNRMVVAIEDLAGIDPPAPSITRTLHHFRINEERTHIQFYFDDFQFLTIPIFEDDRTQFVQTNEQAVFRSHDEAAMLSYQLRFL